jgi:DNA-binding IclR family transcriptional regulator
MLASPQVRAKRSTGPAARGGVQMHSILTTRPAKSSSRAAMGLSGGDASRPSADEGLLPADQEGRVMSQFPKPIESRGSGPALSTGRAVLKVLALLAGHPDGARAADVAGSVLKVLTLLAEQPEGVRAGDVAESADTSTSTAYYLLAGLREEGFAVRDRATGRYRLPRARLPALGREAAPDRDDLEPAVDVLFLRTHKHCYLGRVDGGAIEIVAFRGRQGLPQIAGLGASRIADGLHAVAMGKVLLALLPDEARRRYLERGLRSFTDATITSPHALSAELDQVRERGVAVERDEFQPDVCCVAAPMHDVDGRFVATVGLSATTGAFDAERERLVAAVLDAAAMSKPLLETHALLRRQGLTADRPGSADLRGPDDCPVGRRQTPDAV